MFAEIRSKIALTYGFAHLLRKESGELGKGGAESWGIFRPLKMPERGWARPTLQFRNTPFKNNFASLP